jgi:hypothetical protein
MKATKKIRLIKKQELATPKAKPKPEPKNAFEIVKGWINRRQKEMQQHPRERFDALFGRS